MIEELVMEAEVGKTYLGTVTRLVDFARLRGDHHRNRGLLHISEVADYRVQDINSELKVGDQIPVKVISIEPPNKIRLSRKAVIREAAGLPRRLRLPGPSAGRGRARQAATERPRAHP